MWEAGDEFGHARARDRFGKFQPLALAERYVEAVIAQLRNPLEARLRDVALNGGEFE